MNGHIKEAVRQYITQNVNSEYALMINGPWGCGKTYFVDGLQNEEWLKNTDDKREKKVVKISLYGVTSKEDIDTQLFYATHEKLDNEILKGAGTIIGTFLGGSYNVDGKTAMSMCFKDWSKKVKVIIVDDLERSSMAIHEIMGYFYNYIVEQDIRIIFIGNEDEIKDEEGNLNEHYKRTKEKVIGETYTIQPHIEEAVRVFLSDERKVQIPTPTDIAVKICLDVVNNLQIHNLRTIWQGLVKIQRLLKSVTETEAYKSVQFEAEEYGEHDNTKTDYLNEIFELYLVIYLQMANGTIDKDKKCITKRSEDDTILIDVISVYKREKCSLKSLEEQERSENKTGVNSSTQSETDESLKKLLRTYYGFIPLKSSDEGTKVWSDYLFHSKIDKELLNITVENDKQWFIPKKVEANIKSNLFVLVSSSLELEQDEFEKYYNDTINEFKNGKYTNIGELIQGYSICLTYKKYGVREYEDGEIKSLFDEVIDKTYIEISKDGDYRHAFSSGGMGYAYSTDMTDGEGKEFVDKLRAIVKEKQKVDIKAEFIEEFSSISNSEEFVHWRKLLDYNTDRDYYTYYDKPVLSWLDKDRLFTILIDLSYSNQLRFFDALKSRYGSGRFQLTHTPDFQVLLFLRGKYENYFEELEIGNIKRYKIKELLDRVCGLVEYCGQYVSEEEHITYTDDQAE